MSTVSSFSVTVEAEDYDEAIEKAYEEYPSGVCASCSGWRSHWSLDLGETWEPDSVEQDGKEVYDSGEVWTRRRNDRSSAVSGVSGGDPEPASEDH